MILKTKVFLTNYSSNGSQLEIIIYSSEVCLEDFPGGTVVKNLPANSGDVGLSPGAGRFHMPWSN